MIPVKKSWTNITMGENQEGIIPCPAFRDSKTGDIITAWELTDEEIHAIQTHKTILVKTYAGGRPMQPLQLWVEDSNGSPISDNRI